MDPEIHSESNNEYRPFGVGRKWTARVRRWSARIVVSRRGKLLSEKGAMLCFIFSGSRLLWGGECLKPPERKPGPRECGRSNNKTTIHRPAPADCVCSIKSFFCICIWHISCVAGVTWDTVEQYVKRVSVVCGGSRCIYNEIYCSATEQTEGNWNIRPRKNIGIKRIEEGTASANGLRWLRHFLCQKKSMCLRISHVSEKGAYLKQRPFVGGCVHVCLYGWACVIEHNAWLNVGLTALGQEAWGVGSARCVQLIAQIACGKSEIEKTRRLYTFGSTLSGSKRERGCEVWHTAKSAPSPDNPEEKQSKSKLRGEWLCRSVALTVSRFNSGGVLVVCEGMIGWLGSTVVCRIGFMA